MKRNSNKYKRNVLKQVKRVKIKMVALLVSTQKSKVEKHQEIIFHGFIYFFKFFFVYLFFFFFFFFLFFFFFYLQILICRLYQVAFTEPKTRSRRQEKMKADTAVDNVKEAEDSEIEVGLRKKEKVRLFEGGT